MEDYPAKIADYIESIAVRIRQLTVDRIAVAITWAALGIIILVMGLVAVTFALIGLLRILGEFVGTEWAYVILGGLFLVIAAFLWRMRNPETAESSEEAEAEEKDSAAIGDVEEKPDVLEPSQVGGATEAAESAVTPDPVEKPEAPEPPQVSENE